METPTNKPTHASVTLRGKTVAVKPLAATQVGEVLESVQALGECTPTIRVLERDKWPHLLRVIAISIRHEFLGSTLEELAFELDEAISLDELPPILRVLGESHRNIPLPIEVHKENPDVRLS
ncbi:hypothetical protein [Rhodanobacter hydrolyticus]|uniref:Uncharacterized protein n=1 Tax=Rhodanobacter hydrolyticus TaxID=2250595 RepID=A0ABW8J511_9GAMM